MTGHDLLHPGARLVDAAGGRSLDGAALRAEVAAVSFDGVPEGVLFALTAIDVPSVLRYLAAFESGRAVALLDAGQDAGVLLDLVGRFRPAAVLGAAGEPPAGYRAGDVAGPAWVRADPAGVVPHPDLAVLLPTSGSTGNPKFVRLSRAAVLANAGAIADVLGIDGAEVAPTSLPLHYSYGMSVLNSHLLRGATVVVEPTGVMGRPFWQAVEEHKITSLAGVPYHYEMLRRLRFDPAKYPTLRTITQAGGKLRDELVVGFNDLMTAVGGRMFVMYGQTEAAPRMATVPAERLADKVGSAGPALPGGAFAIRSADGVETTAPDVVGEVLYRGPNVMMGYAEGEAELALGDVTGGVLETGDLGRLDAEGYLFITGRLKRIGKVFGNRVSLDDVERFARAAWPGSLAAVPAGDKVVVWLETAAGDDRGADRKAVARALSEKLRLHVTGFDVRAVEALPLLASGKVDYRALEDRA
ncbi:AMP-binding protein [Saccharothrix algeriensis]|uniref:Acyl-CoA synthetase (AMP-forming)/AMP-acid ligase II n=1 Tax=Saccharothrix algeriensis TaxID=173560 RepID=A0ABS2S857_9PSEU|nr:AMP-binding protein [Saccharothrix algeriensis]MBM7812035.1 acyl-CoA synthetase (AMP-forming)/AMP-acid ligase II [Saccharothrix algeriensis]